MRAISGLLSQMIHENCAIVLTFAYSREPLIDLRAKFKGDWKYLDKTLFELPEVRADRSLLELAIHLRTMDDEEGIGASSDRKGRSFGTLEKSDGTEDILTFRQMTNKIIHAIRTDWDFRKPNNPHVTCISGEPKLWRSASICLEEVANLCGELMF